MKTLFSLFFSALCLLPLNAQETGALVGKILDKDMNDDPLPFANILIEGSTFGTTTDFDGLFEINNILSGNYNVTVSFVGYESQTINVDVVGGKVTEINLSLGVLANSLEEVVVTTVARRDSETALLIDQKNAMVMKQEIGAEEISKKGLGDVATALVKTTGVTKQEGSGTIFVRGLGDRYNITLYNGLPLPSNNPSKKNINLELFKSDIVNSISIDKVFQVANYGDFAGASVDIKSKENAGLQTFSFSLGGGVNSEANGVDTFYLNNGPNKTGFYNTSYPDNPLSGYNFTESFDRQKRISGSMPVNSSIGLSFNKAIELGENKRLSIFAVGNFDSEYTYSSGASRGSVNTGGLVYKDFEFKKFQYETNTTGMVNLGYRSDKLKLKLNSLLVNSSVQDQQEYLGVIDVFDYAPEGGGYVQRAVFERTTLLVNQFLADYTLNDRMDINLGVSYNQVDNIIPDRRQTTITPEDWDEPNGPLSFKNFISAGDNHRFFQNLEENEIAANFNFDYKFGAKDEEDEYRSKLSLGYNGKMKTFAFDATQFNFQPITRRNGVTVQQPIVDSPYNIDSYFNQTNFDNGLFEIRTFRGKAGIANVLDPQTYNGNQNIHGGYVALEYKLGPKTTILLGLRGESIFQEIEWDTAVDPQSIENPNILAIDTFEFLPSLIGRYELSDKQNLRLSFSKTYTLPQIKERALFQFEEVTQVYIGNPALYASTDYNLDLKWEFFPSNSELFSVGVFGKYIENPINTAAINSASNDISYVNSGEKAVAFGVEIESRKILFQTQREVADDLLDKIVSLGLNFSYLNTNQELDPEKVLRESEAVGLLPLSVDFTNTEDRLTGASDFFFNVDMTYLHEFKADKNIQASLLFNYFSDQIFAFGVQGKGNFVDKGFPTLNFVLKSRLNKNFGVNIAAKNLLNPTIERIQETQDVVLLSYKKGVTISAGINYNF